MSYFLLNIIFCVCLNASEVPKQKQSLLPATLSMDKKFKTEVKKPSSLAASAARPLAKRHLEIDPKTKGFKFSMSSKGQEEPTHTISRTSHLGGSIDSKQNERLRSYTEPHGRYEYMKKEEEARKLQSTDKNKG